MGRTVANNAAQAKEATSGFKPLPAGDYVVEIIDTQEGKYSAKSANAGKDKWEVQFRVLEPEEYAGKKFKDFGIPQFDTWKSGKPAHTYYQFFGALGVDFSGDTVELPDPEEVWEEQLVVRLKVEPKQDSETEFQNKVGSYFPLAHGIKQVPAGADDAAVDDQFAV